MKLIGNQVLAPCNGAQVSGTHEKFGIQKKSDISSVGICTHEFRNIMVHIAVMNPERNQKK
jgi:hypothetical protein